MMKGKFEMDEAMDIMICTHEKDASSVLKGVKACFSQEFPTEEFEWKCTETTLTVVLPVGDKEITRVFEELVRRYPRLEVSASCSYDIREEDRSAQWWGTTRIYSKRENGEAKIVSSSSTCWN